MDDATGADLHKLSDWLKRIYILEGTKRRNMFELMKQFATMNTGRVSKRMIDMLDGDIANLYNVLSNDDYLQLKQKDLAALMEMSPSTLCKIIAKKH